MTTPRPTHEATIDDGLLRSRIGLYVKVLFLVHLGFMVLSFSELIFDLEMPRANTPTAAQRLVDSSLTAGLGLLWWHSRD